MPELRHNKTQHTTHLGTNFLNGTWIEMHIFAK